MSSAFSKSRFQLYSADLGVNMKLILPGLIIGLFSLGCQNQSQFSADKGTPSFEGEYSLSIEDQRALNLYDQTIVSGERASNFVIDKDQLIYFKLISEEKPAPVGYINAKHLHIHFNSEFVQQYWGNAYVGEVVCQFIVETTNSTQTLISTECSGYNTYKEENVFLPSESAPQFSNFEYRKN